MAGRPRTRKARNLGIACGARTRDGAPCQRKALWANGRCLNHGGPSTGPRTPLGKERSIAAMREGWRNWRNRIKEIEVHDAHARARDVSR
jgi:hypothetical protein